MAMCDALGCLPSELHIKHPNMTRADRMAMMRFCARKYVKQAELLATALGGSGEGWNTKPFPMTGR